MVSCESGTSPGSRRGGRQVLVAATIAAPIAFLLANLLAIGIALGGPSSEPLEVHWHRALLKALVGIVVILCSGVVLGWRLRDRRPGLARVCATTSLLCSLVIVLPVFTESFVSGIQGRF
jgi:hypothetical protein